jgi:site-specific DNA recombinase
MSDLEQFKVFTKKAKGVQLNTSGKAVIYTRVSTKEQADNNSSLTTQKKYCEEFATRKGLEIIEYFGGTYESAKSDERKEFQRMLSYVKKNKSIACIIVYSYDRFSRTGANGAYISAQLKKQGIITLSATQEVDATTNSGTFQQNLYYLFSQFDNEIRRDKSVTGMKEKLRRGYWIGTVPFGYTNVNPGKGREQQLIINKKGKALRLAFKLKVEQNLTHAEIEQILDKKGCIIPRKRLSDYFRNPFYCGLIVSSHIPGEIVQGKHPIIVSRANFLKTNDLLKTRGYGDKLNKDNENLPLKQFVRSASCKTPFTGYLVKKKGLYYYKNNRLGSKENRSAKKMHEMFELLIAQYQLTNNKLRPLIKDVMLNSFKKQQEDTLLEIEVNKKAIHDIEKKLLRLEERFVFEEINSAQYEKFKSKLTLQKKEKLLFSEKVGFDLSNLEKALDIALNKAPKLSSMWANGNLAEKRKIQKMVFPDGIEYDRKNDEYRTFRVNSFFSYIPLIADELEHKKTGKFRKKSKNSGSVPRAGLEPARPKTLVFETNASTNSATWAI